MDNSKDNTLQEAESIENWMEEKYNKAISKMQEAEEAQDLDLYIECLSEFCLLTALEPNYLDCELKIQQCKEMMIKIQGVEDIFE